MVLNNLKEKYGEWAIVTGASSGIGREFSLRLAREGVNTILVARRKERLEELAAEIKNGSGADAVVVPLDLADDNFITGLTEAVGDREVGMLINNAGFGSTGKFVENNPVHEADMVKVNCWAPTVLTHHFMPQMVQRRKGAVVFLGSVVSHQPTPLMASYAATKVFNTFLADALWYEMREHNIDVLSLHPGATDTEFQRISKTAENPQGVRTPKQVVDTAMKALGKKPEVVDGFVNKIMAVSGRLFPIRWIINISGVIAKKFFEKKK